ncbi:hypothetical protein [Spirosoma koreense]
MMNLIRYYAPERESIGGPNQPPGHSHADNYDPDTNPDRNVAEDGPSGENTKNNGEHGGGLWTSGGEVITGNANNDGEFGKPQPDRQATPYPGTESN